SSSSRLLSMKVISRSRALLAMSSESPRVMSSLPGSGGSSEILERITSRRFWRLARIVLNSSLMKWPSSVDDLPLQTCRRWWSVDTPVRQTGECTPYPWQERESREVRNSQASDLWYKYWCGLRPQAL